jgi:HK97 gp10 family phage protein
VANDDFVKGLNDLLAELKDLPGNIEKIALRSSVVEGSKVMAEAVSKEAPVAAGGVRKGKFIRNRKTKQVIAQRVHFPGNLKRSFKAASGRASKGEVSSGVRGDYYARFVEFGHALKSHGKKAARKVIGHVPPNPFMMRAFEATKDQVLETTKRSLIEQIEKRIARARAKLLRDFGKW